MIRALVLAGVALLATGCTGSSSPPPEPSAVLVLHYTPSYNSMIQQSAPRPIIRRLRCASPMTPLCAAAVLVGRHRTGYRRCEGTIGQPPDLVVDGTLHGRPVDIDLRGCWTGFPPRMQRA